MIFSNRFTDEKRDIFEHSFSVKEGTPLLAFEILVCPFEHITLSLFSETGHLEALFTFKARKKTFKFSSPRAGQWALKIIRAYPISPQREKHYEISFKMPEEGQGFTDHYELNRQWEPFEGSGGQGVYRGDIHTHTSFSDGRMTSQELLSTAALVPLDFLSITDHNVWVREAGFPLISAVEYTPDDFGHFNIYGITEELPLFEIFSKTAGLSEALQQVLTLAQNKNWAVSINHPFDLECPASRNFPLEATCLLEVINSPVDENASIKNETALQAMDWLWNRGCKIFACGGSDAHRAAVDGYIRTGRPSMNVLSQDLRGDSLLESIRKGRSYITCGAKVSFALGNGEREIFFGDEVSGQVSIKGEADRRLLWKLMKNGIIFNYIFGEACDFNVFLGEGDFVRVDGFGQDKNLVLVTNPIFYSVPSNKDLMWFDVLEAFGRKKLED